jgi:tRNA pseudouridine38-40 synthase
VQPFGRADVTFDGVVSHVRYCAVVAYDGTDFHGFQRQAHADRPARTVQDVLEQALRAVVGHGADVVGAGRTDAGVHASGQVVHFDLAAAPRLALTELERAVNARLPSDVHLRELSLAPAGFHARFSASSRCYRYTIDNGGWANPFIRRYAWHVRSELNVSEMQAGCQALIGLHDFVAFAAREAPGPTLRRVLHASVRLATGPTRVGAEDSSSVWHNSEVARFGSPSGGRVIVIEVEANAFLRHMVRRIVGSLVRVGRGWCSATELARILAERAKANAGPAAPARGLELFRVAYGNGATMG